MLRDLLRNAGWLFLGTLLLWGVFAVALDVAVVLLYGVRFTISWQTQQFARANPIAAFLCCLPIGLLVVHFFKVRDLSWFDPDQPVHAAVLGLLCGGLGAAFWWTQRG